MCVLPSLGICVQKSFLIPNAIEVRPFGTERPLAVCKYDVLVTQHNYV